MNDDAFAYLELMRLQRAYADIATRRAWPEIAALAIPGARFSFDTRSGRVIEVDAGALGEFGARATAQFSFYEYIPLNAVVTIDATGTARGRSYALEVGELRDTREWINFYGFYHDDYVRLDGTWRFARRQYQTLARRTGDRMETFLLMDRAL
jgi:SnoaL-like domain